MDNTGLRAHQLIMLEMLVEIDKICKKHDIQYMLFAGTLLGAVRHQGFIPWDDDLDIVMLRPEYERFLQIAPQELDAEKYYLQKEFSKHWPMFFSKLRKNNTACIERYIPKDEKTHQGIYIDIFPCDNLSDSVFMRNIQFWASKLVIANALRKRGYLTNNLIKKVFLLFCEKIPLEILREIVCLRNKNCTEKVHTFFGGSSKYLKSVYPRRWFENESKILFEGEVFPVSTEKESLLTLLYGNFMTPLPENKRGCKVHGEIVDCEKSYEIYLEDQKKMKISEFTRSIR